jgi:regulator of sigma E protease
VSSVLGLLSDVWPWVLVVLGFSLLIVLHEGGHFALAKAVGMRVERFFLFFPPRLVSKRVGETEYGIGAIPLGGFVKITGMNPDEVREHPPEEEGEEPKRDWLTAIESADPGPDTPRSAEGPEPLPPDQLDRAYYRQPVWKRIVVIAAGPAVNIVLAFLILFALAFTIKEGTELVVGEPEPGTPAARILEPGDRILAVDRVKVKGDDLAAQGERISNQIDSHECAGQPTKGCRAETPVRIVVERDGERVVLHARPFYDPAVERFRLGFPIREGGLVPVDPSVPGAAEIALDQMWFVSSKTVTVIARIFEPEQREQVSGIVGTSAVAREVIDFGPREALFLLAIVSLSLGLINLFPFLPLDGGHIFWSVVEKVRGSPVPFSVMERAGALGFVLVILLFVIGLTNDIGRITGEGFDVR